MIEYFIVNILPYILSALAIYCMWAVGKYKKVGWQIGFWSQACWLIWIVTTKNWGFIPLNLASWFVYGNNYISWKKKEAETLTN